MHTREEIIAGLRHRFEEVLAWFAQRPDTTFCTGPAGRWTEGQHLDHLILSAKPLNLALRLPRLALKMRFGTTTSGSETLEKLSVRYEKRLADGGRASGNFVPPAVKVEDKSGLLDELRKQGEKLADVVGAWSEPDLDKYVLPHPLLGNLSIRDMLLFTYLHLGHHLDILKRDY